MSHQLATAPDDYGRAYYEHEIGDGAEPYAWSSPGWRAFFTQVAQRLLDLTPGAQTVLDVGCAKGLLVQAFVEQGADARGFDLSQHAIEDADEAIRDRLASRSATEPIEGRFDLITCIEVLEHLSPSDAELAIDRMCAATDRIVMYSTPEDFHEPTHGNVYPTAGWAAAFAARGFFRRTDIDLGFLTPWAIYLERGELSPRDVVHRYEGALAAVRTELLGTREVLLKALPADDDGQDLRQRVQQLEHELLRLRDHARGCEATAATSRVRAERATFALYKAERELQEIRASRTWLLGRVAVKPLSLLKRGIKGALRD